MRKFMMGSVLFLLSVAGYSQFVVFGAKAGLNLATVTGNDYNDAAFHPSFHVGATANFLVNENFTVQPEVLYSGKGVKDGSFGTVNLGYINVPVLLQYKTPSGFFLETGPQIGFLISAKRKNNGANADIKNELKSTDYAWVGGLGYKSTMGIGASARFDYGFANIANAGIVRNKTILISIFYVFGSVSQD